MTTVQLQLPSEIVDALDLPYEGLRDMQGIVVAIDGLNVAASLVTLGALRSHAEQLVRAIRRWRMGMTEESMTLVVKGRGIDLKIKLPRNVGSAELLDGLRPLLDEPPEPTQ